MILDSEHTQIPYQRQRVSQMPQMTIEDEVEVRPLTLEKERTEPWYGFSEETNQLWTGQGSTLPRKQH